MILNFIIRILPQFVTILPRFVTILPRFVTILPILSPFVFVKIMGFLFRIFLGFYFVFFVFLYEQKNPFLLIYIFLNKFIPNIVIIVIVYLINIFSYLGFLIVFGVFSLGFIFLRVDYIRIVI
jgi:hypothetical protein